MTKTTGFPLVWCILLFHSDRMDFPASLVAGNGHVTKFWPMRLMKLVLRQSWNLSVKTHLPDCQVSGCSGRALSYRAVLKGLIKPLARNAAVHVSGGRPWHQFCSAALAPQVSEGWYAVHKGRCHTDQEPWTNCCFVAKSCPTLLQPHELFFTRLLCPWAFPGKNTGVGCHFFSRGSSQPRDGTLIYCTAGRFFTTQLPAPAFSWNQGPRGEKR